jgi:ribosome-binding ATPase YchF (GTP1/OBG family)
MMFVLNVGEADAAPGAENALTRAARAAIAERAAAQAGGGGGAAAYAVATVCAQVEAELALLPDGAERSELLAAYGLPASGMDDLIVQTARLLGLSNFYTQGPQESRSWVIPRGATAVEAAGAIHGDMKDGFIKAEVIAYDAFMAAGSEAAARALSAPPGPRGSGHTLAGATTQEGAAPIPSPALGYAAWRLAVALRRLQRAAAGELQLPPQRPHSTE